MKILSFVLLVSIYVVPSFADESLKKQYCEQTRSDYQEKLSLSENMLSVGNKSGLQVFKMFGFETGLCWWHSRFHRNANYLTYFCEDCAPKRAYSKREIRKIIKDIINAKRVVRIDGAKNLREWTDDPVVEKILINELQQWARRSTLALKFVNGMVGSYNFSLHDPRRNVLYIKHIKNMSRAEREALPTDYAFDFVNNLPFWDRLNPSMMERRFPYRKPEKLERKREKTLKEQRAELEKLYKQVEEEKKVAFVFVQFPGLPAHAFLIFDVKRIETPKGIEYKLGFQDSNRQIVRYHDGSKKLFPAQTMTFRTDGSYYIHWREYDEYGRIFNSSDIWESFNLYLGIGNPFNKKSYFKKIEKRQQQFCSSL